MIFNDIGRYSMILGYCCETDVHPPIHDDPSIHGHPSIYPCPAAIGT